MAATPSIATIRSAIITAVKSALNAGSPASVVTVHDYRRWWNDEQKFRSLFKRTDTGGDVAVDTINGWMVTRVSTREEEAPEWFRFWQLHRFELHGWMALRDATGSSNEKVFQDQIEKIRDNLRLNTSVFVTTERAKPEVSVESIQRFELGQTTTWMAVLSLEPEAIETKFA